MGKMLSFLVVATLIGGAYAHRSTTQHNLETTNRQAERQAEVLAREVARSGFNHVLSLAREEEATRGPNAPVAEIIAAVNGADKMRTGTLNGATYRAWLERSGPSGYDIIAVGNYADASHQMGNYRQRSYIEVTQDSDLQVTFLESSTEYCSALFLEIIKPMQNNGHGNNNDGCDASNPGETGCTDSDSTVDDETKESTATRYELIFPPGTHRDGELAKYATTLKKGLRVNVLLAVDADNFCERAGEAIKINDASIDYVRRAYASEVSSLNDFVEGPYAMVEPHPSYPALWRVAFEDLEFGGQRDGRAKLADLKANGYYQPLSEVVQYWRSPDGVAWTYGGTGWPKRDSWGYHRLRDYTKDGDGNIMPDFSDQVVEVELIPVGGSSVRSASS